MPRGMKAWVILAALALRLTAQETGERWRFSGFGTLGLASSSTNLADYARDLSQPRGTSRNLDPRLDSRLGVQGNLTLTDEFSLVGQVVSKYRYDHTFTPDLSWGFLSYAPISGLQARIGRLGWDVFQLADTRNVGYSYLWARPPVDFYGPLMASNLDGVDVAWTSSVGGNRNVRFKLSAGRASEKVPLGDSGLNMDLSGGKLFGAMAEFQGQAINLRATYAQMRTAKNFPSPISDIREGLNAFALLMGDPGLARQAEAMAFKDHLFRYSSLGLSWNEGPLQVEAVAAQLHSDSGMIPGFKSGYLSIGYRKGTVAPYFLASRVVSGQPDSYVGALPELGPEAAALANAVTMTLTRMRSNQTTLALGLRWDFHSKAAFKAQVDRVSALPDWTFPWPKIHPGWEGKATVASVVLDFVF